MPVRMRLVGFAALMALAVGPACASAQQATFEAGRLSEHVRILSQDSFGGRRPATDGERLTLDYLQAQYEAMGLEPGGPNGQWRQPVTLTRYTPQPGASLTATVGGRSVDLVAAGSAVVRASYGDGQASVTNAPVVFAGYGIHAPERDWNDYGDLDVRGAVVVVMMGEPGDERFNGEFPTLYSLDLYKTEEAFRRGAAAVLFVLPVASGDAAFTQAVTQIRNPATSVVGVENIEATGYVAIDPLTEWARGSGLDLQRAFAKAENGTFQASDLEGVTLSLSASETVEQVQTYNLMARIPGTERPDETIIVSAHWDHVGSRDTPDSDGDTIYNGAWDNASGTAGVLEMARVLSSGPAPERTIVFAHMAAEEMGLLGAYYYAENPIYPLETTVADLNIDMLPLSPPTRDLPIFGVGQNSLEDDLAALAAEEGRVITDDGRPEEGFYYRSDHFPYALAGVPALMPWHGVDWDEGGREAGEPAYRQQWTTFYHRRADEWSAELDWRSAVENLELLRRLATDLANSERWPTWKETSEFAATRAASDAARQ